MDVKRWLTAACAIAVACTPFGSSPDPAPEAGPDGGAVPQDAASDLSRPGEEDAGAGGALPCDVGLVEPFVEPFDSQSTAWKVSTAGGSIGLATTFPDAAVAGTTGSFLLASATTTSQLNQPARWERDVLLRAKSARLDFRFAYTAMEPQADVGCALSLYRASGPEAEVRLVLDVTNNGGVPSRLAADGAYFENKFIIPNVIGFAELPMPPALTWVRVASEISIDSSRKVDMSVSINGVRAVVAPYVAQHDFESVRIACGILKATAVDPQAVEKIGLDDVKLSVCPK